jgi:hypothetical protein
MKRHDPIPDPTYKPAYKLKETKTIPDPAYKPTYKIKEQNVIADPAYKPAYKLRTLTSDPKPVGKSLVQSFISIFTPSKSEKPPPLVSNVDVAYADVFLPSVAERVRPLPEANAKVLPKVSASALPEAPVRKSIVITPRPTPKPIEIKPVIVAAVHVVVPVIAHEPVPGSRAWKKKQFMSSNFI